MIFHDSINKNGRKILIVDDDVILCSVFKDILEESGYQTFIAQNEKDVLSIITQEAVDLAYVDLEMPALNCVGISNHIKRINPNTLVVLISGYPRQVIEDEINLSIGEGVIDKFIDKVDLFNLSSVTDELLSEKPT